MATDEENMQVTVIQAAGGLVWRDSPHGKEIAIIHRGRYHDWTLPKGKLNPGENWYGAAVREVKEEIGCNVRLESFAGVVNYCVKGIPKVVLFWNMSSIGECEFKPSEEVDQVLWLTVKKALKKLQYPDERNLLKISYSGCFSGWRSYISGKKAKCTRLKGEILAFEEELKWLKEKTEEEANMGADSCCARSSDEMLIKAKEALAGDNFNLGWSFLNTARGMSLLCSNSDVLKDYRAAKAEVIWAEADDKLGSWRKKAVKSVLIKNDKIKENIKGDDLFRAHETLSEHFENQYHRIDEFERHLWSLAIVASAAIVSLILLASTVSNISIKFFDSKYIITITLFGIMGAIVSGMLSARGGTQARIPEQRISNSMTFAKLVVGAMSALAIYVFIASELLSLKFDGDVESTLILAASFAAGFTERLVNRAVETVAQRDSSK